MTKMFKITAALIGIALMVFLVNASLELRESTKEMKDELDTYFARKDELVGEQARLEALILDLNRTIQMEAEKQKDLTNRLAELGAEKQALEQAAILAAQEVPQPVQEAPPPKPAPRPVTRAS